MVQCKLGSGGGEGWQSSRPVGLEQRTQATQHRGIVASCVLSGVDGGKRAKRVLSTEGCTKGQPIEEDALLGQGGLQMGNDKLSRAKMDAKCNYAGQSRVPNPDVMVGGEPGRAPAVLHTRVLVGFKRRLPLERVRLESMVQLMRGEDVRILKDSHCILVGAEVSLQVAKCGGQRKTPACVSQQLVQSGWVTKSTELCGSRKLEQRSGQRKDTQAA